MYSTGQQRLRYLVEFCCPGDKVGSVEGLVSRVEEEAGADEDEEREISMWGRDSVILKYGY